MKHNAKRMTFAELRGGDIYMPYTLAMDERVSYSAKLLMGALLRQGEYEPGFTFTFPDLEDLEGMAESDLAKSDKLEFIRCHEELLRYGYIKEV